MNRKKEKLMPVTMENLSLIIGLLKRSINGMVVKTRLITIHHHNNNNNNLASLHISKTD